ncbi:hypothetical protein [Runella sp.]|uniref:hypothetical protein n=1 Tax=Runella sp. TaxID=1960881 RepID=UPI003018DB09
MKSSFYFFTLTFLFSIITAGSSSATVFRVNNSLTENIPGGLFTTLQRAHEHFSVKNGDTLMVEGSQKAYESLTCTKRLVIIGPGYFLGENSGVNAIVTSAQVSGVTFKEGSQGSYLIGIETIYPGLDIYTSNIYVLRCKLSTLFFQYASNCKIVMSHINGSIGAYVNNTNISITNSIIGSDATSTYLSYLTYENNILVGKNAWEISAGTFRNNILLERDAKVSIKSPNIQNNLAPNAQFGTDNGNRAYEPADLFVSGTSSSDGKYRVKANSPYVAAGYGGTQPGIFGGSEPYALSGIPPVPIIYELNVPGTGSAASGLNINVKIRGAN